MNTTTPARDRIPCDAGHLACLMRELDNQVIPGQPDPALGLWERLKDQEGHEAAERIWSKACMHYDHMFADDDAPEA